MKDNVENILQNKDFEFLHIIFRNLMELQIPRKYIYKLELKNEPKKIVEHYNVSYPSGEPEDVEYLVLNDITMTLDEKYCSKSYSVTGSDLFTYIEDETKFNYTAKREILNKCISSLMFLDKNKKMLYPEYYVVYETGEDEWRNIYQKNRIFDNKIEIKIKEV